MDCFAKTFGLVFGAALGLDILVMLSMVVSWRISARSPEVFGPSAAISDIFGVMIFATYIGVSSLPMVSTAAKVYHTIP